MTDKMTPSPEIVANPGDLPVAERWPQVEAKDSCVYGFIDPAFGGEMVAMNLNTWKAIIQDVTVMKRRLDQLTAENIEMKQGRHLDGPRIVLPN